LKINVKGTREYATFVNDMKDGHFTSIELDGTKTYRYFSKDIQDLKKAKITNAPKFSDN
jgi:hypothetical protein